MKAEVKKTTKMKLKTIPTGNENTDVQPFEMLRSDFKSDLSLV